MQALCKGISPRPSTSEKERQAADNVETTLRKHDYPAICLAGYNKNGMLANSHRLSNRLENTQPEVQGRAAGFTWGLLQEIDRQD